MKKTSLHPRHQISESIELCILLTLSGGFMDAYSYLCRGHVFANAQTGNILLLGVYLSQGNYDQAVHYIFPILSFGVGIACSDLNRHFLQQRVSLLHWRQFTVLFEAILFLIVSFLPQSQNLAANCLISLACGAQVESFRKIHGCAAATTMCIGNFRTATQSLGDYFFTKDRLALRKSLLFYGIILCFMIGAIIGSIAISYLAERAIVISCGLMEAAFLLMFINRKE